MNKTPLTFSSGHRMPNRFSLAPLTNLQSHEDGRLSDDEFHWLTLRAKGGFGLTMTCASHVQAVGKGFPGQLGIFSEIHQSGHRRLAKAIKEEGSLAVIQLHHAGMRSPKELIAQAPMCPSDQPKYGAKGMTLVEVEKLRDDFILAAKRAQEWGYDGVQVHGAHGYILGQFLSHELNNRQDKYGGDLEGRSRLIIEIIDGIRQTCGAQFLVGIRLSPERFGMVLEEVKSLCRRLISEGQVDFLDISVWDWQKYPEEEKHKDKTLLQHFTELDYKDVKLTVAGKIYSATDVQAVLAQGVDFVTIGKAAILHYDFPKQVVVNPQFSSHELPVTMAYLKEQGLGKEFIKYLQGWTGFVKG